MDSVDSSHLLAHVTVDDDARVLYLDIIDLLAYLRENVSVSGIQRVVINLIVHGEAAATRNGARFVLVAPEYDRQLVHAVSNEAVQAMLDILSCAEVDRTALDRAMDAVYQSRDLVFPLRDDVFAIAGAFWIYPDYDLLMIMRRRGVRIVPFIHDLIQISHPEFVHADASERFRRAFIDISACAAGLLANSHYVAQDTRCFLADRTSMALPVTAVPLATELTKPSDPPVDTSMPDPRVAMLIRKPYVLSVSTIEIRKNHAYIVRVWEALISAGEVAVPDLVFVGKIGWDIDSFIADLARHNYLGGKLHILSNVSDQALAELYRHASFTMYMSFVEGFGLPVAESLGYGVPCIASNRASMPEVGGNLARYLDPEDVPSGVALVRRLLEHPDELTAWRDNIIERFRTRSWAEFANDFVSAALAVPSGQARVCNGRFAAGEIYGMGRWEVARRDARGETLSYLAPTRLRGWHANADWGCWATGSNASLILATELCSGDTVVVQMLLKAPPAAAVRLAVRLNDSVMMDLGDLPARAVWRRCTGTIDADGILSLDFVADGDNGSEGHFALLAIAFARSDDMEARLAILETLTFDRHRMAAPPELPRRKFRATMTANDEIDPAWYLEMYPDVQLLGMSADEHFKWLGRRLGRKPNPTADEFSVRDPHQGRGEHNGGADHV